MIAKTASKKDRCATRGMPAAAPPHAPTRSTTIVDEPLLVHRPLCAHAPHDAFRT